MSYNIFNNIFLIIIKMNIPACNPTFDNFSIYFLLYSPKSGRENGFLHLNSNPQIEKTGLFCFTTYLLLFLLI
jgi:hypothetical protein